MWFINKYDGISNFKLYKSIIWKTNRSNKIKTDSISEIDIVGLNEDEEAIIFGECKYYKDGKQMEAKVFYELKEKSKLVDWKNGNRKEMFILFSASGYTDELKKITKESNELILA